MYRERERKTEDKGPHPPPLHAGPGLGWLMVGRQGEGVGGREAWERERRGTGEGVGGSE